MTWIFKDGRNRVTSDSSVGIIYQDMFYLLVPNTEFEGSRHISKRFDLAFFEAFPQFKIEEYKREVRGVLLFY